MWLKSLICLFLWTSLALGAKIQFKADVYDRDFAKNITTAKGNAWLKIGAQEVFADEMEIDFGRKLAVANGNVHYKDGNIDVYCEHANYNLAGEDAEMEGAVLVSGQMVLTGNIIYRKSRTHYEVSEGSYTNCNTEKINKAEAGQCTFDWKVFGKRLTVNIGGYAHVEDAILYTSGLPILYLPYFFLPVKTKRQSGLLQSSMGYTANLGTQITFPYYWAIGDWHDLTVTPSWHSRQGYHLGFNYRYLYDHNKHGDFKLFITQRRFNPNRDSPGSAGPASERFLGFIGEVAVKIENKYAVGKRGYIGTSINHLSDPYYLFDYSTDMETPKDVASLRSLIYLTLPGDSSLLTAKLQHNQSIIIPEDTGVDRGEVTQLPSLQYALTSSDIYKRYFFFEFQSNFSNFYRPDPSFDSVSATLDKNAKFHSDPNPSFHTGNYVREGRRIHLEPKLIANFPLFTGVQFQPTLTAGTLLYHFDVPQSQVIGRYYGDLELPASLYISRSFSSTVKGFERVSHVIQPRFVYANRLFLGGNSENDHPFFYKDSTRELSNPRFDLIDQLPPFEYMRFELINRLRRRTHSGVERFFLFQLSNQYNINTIADDNRFSRRFGPLEMLGEFRFWRLSAQLEADYFLEKVQRPDGSRTRESSWSSYLTYEVPDGDRFSLGTRFKFLADSSLNEKTALFSWYKRLPLFFDFLGDLEYSLLSEEFVRYRLGFLLGARKPNCWSLLINVGENELNQAFINFRFQLDFGAL